MNGDLSIVVCPHCGAEYLPCELLVEDGLLGDAHGIVKDSSGHIIRYSGNATSIHDSYICDFCNKPFSIDGELSLSTSKEDDVEEECVVPLYGERVALSED